MFSRQYFCFSPLVNSDEEVLISEEELPFKDDPRDETYKPHLDRYYVVFSFSDRRIVWSQLDLLAA